jgi:hypothetical protein
VIGAVKFLSFLFMIISGVYRHFIRISPDLFKAYAKDKNSWALVTGASDGFGAEYCRQLA